MENWTNLKEERSALNIKAVCADRNLTKINTN
jgi:hypothetical protein